MTGRAKGGVLTSRTTPSTTDFSGSTSKAASRAESAPVPAESAADCAVWAVRAGTTRAAPLRERTSVISSGSSGSSGSAGGRAHAFSSTAVTPWPPAAQTEIRPRAPGSAPSRAARSLARVATMRAPVAAKGWPVASDGSSDVEAFPRSTRRRGRASPRRQGGQHLGGERLVDLEEFEVLDAEARALQHPRARRRRAPSAARPRPAAVLVEEVDGRGLVGGQVGERRQVRAPRPTPRSRAARSPRRRSAGWSCRPSWWRPAEPVPKTGFSSASLSAEVPGRRFWSRASPRKGVTRSSRKPLS